MAKIVSDTIVIEISRIAKEDQELGAVINEELITTLEQVVNQLVGEGAVVEVNTGQ